MPLRAPRTKQVVACTWAVEACRPWLVDAHVVKAESCFKHVALGHTSDPLLHGRSEDQPRCRMPHQGRQKTQEHRNPSAMNFHDVVGTRECTIRSAPFAECPSTDGHMTSYISVAKCYTATFEDHSPSLIVVVGAAILVLFRVLQCGDCTGATYLLVWGN
eukprot:6474210-Amphidinium_carterae.1